MGLLEQAREDVRSIMSNPDEFGVSMTLTAPNAETATIVGLHSKHHLGFDSEAGRDVNIQNAHVSFSERDLIAANANYPIRSSANNKVIMNGHRVEVADSTGTVCKYVITESFPDETVGAIVCILGNFKQS